MTTWINMNNQTEYVTAYQQFRTIEADTSKYFHGFLHETNVKNRFCQVNVTEVTWTIIHTSCAGQAP